MHGTGAAFSARHPLLGREGELLVVHEVLRQTAQDGSASVTVAGEAGIGKTELLREASAHARALGLVTATGSATELDQSVPFALANRCDCSVPAGR